jgi:putative flippase GtrA
MQPLLTLFLSPRVQKILRFLIAGTSTAGVNILILFLLVHFVHVYYLLASVIAYLLSIVVGFTLQKFFTFRDHAIHEAHVQFSLYLVVTLTNLVVNTLLMYIFVTVLGVWYIFAQLFAGVAIAVIGYFGYQKLVFTTPSSELRRPN